MESAKTEMRAIFPLLKARVVEKDSHGFKLAIGGSTTITVSTSQMHLIDIRDGDLLTLYTEVVLAQPSQTSVQ
jgi:hypothetical protein